MVRTSNLIFEVTLTIQFLQVHSEQMHRIKLMQWEFNSMESSALQVWTEVAEVFRILRTSRADFS